MAQPSGKAGADRNVATSAKQGGTVAPPVKQPTAPNKAAVANGQAQTEQPDPYKLRDLIAQEDMAYWAMWMFFAAVLTFVVTSFGTFLIWKQVKLTRQAVEDTGQATEAMRAANEIAQDAAYRDLRAYISIEEVRVVEASTEKLRGFIRIKNTGNTPSEYRIYLTSWIAPFPLDTNAQKAAPNPPEYGHHKKFINRHGEEKIEWQYPDQGMSQSLDPIVTLLSQADQYAIYLYGRLEFIDYRDRHRNLYFAFRSQETIAPYRPFEMISCQYGGGYEYMGQPPPEKYYKA